MKLKDDEIAGVSVEIDVNTGGRFAVKNSIGDTIGSDYNLEAAITAARAALAKSKVRVSVEFRTTAGERGVATGIHAATKNVLARIGDQSTQMTYRDLNRVLSADTPDEDLARPAKIAKSMHDLAGECRRIESKYKIDLKAAVEKAITDAAS